MRIAQIAPLCEAVPPRYYGGTERVVAHLCDELARRGHDVVLFASGDSRTAARLVACRDTAIRLDPRPSSEAAAHLAMLIELRKHAGDFDLLHFHIEALHLPLFADMAHRTVTTLHGRLDVKDLARLFLHFPQFPMVSISDSQRRPLPHLRWMGTAYHGYPRRQYAFSPFPTGGYLAFLGRVSPVARRARLPLRVAAKVDRVERPYFERRVRPLLRSPGVDFVGEIGETEKSAFLGGALALLAPVDWPEPFGLVMIESMACGTPVIAFPRGSVPEIIDDGVSGFVVPDVAAAVGAIDKARDLDRRAVRRTFERRFAVEAMVDAYETIYRRCLDGTGDAPSEDRSGVAPERAA